MSTVLTPAGIDSITSIRVLTNQMGHSIALELTPGQITNIEPDKLLFYDTIVTSDNIDTINTLITNGILGDVTIDLINPTPAVQTTSGGTFVASVSSNKNVKLINKEQNQLSNHLEVVPVLDEYNNLLITYYRDVEGISYSLDSGLSSILIDNTNLMYPDEITSLGVQIYDSVITQKYILKLFIGTLREGIKTFTPGIDTTYQSFVNLDSVGTPSIITGTDSSNNPIWSQSTINYLFKHTKTSTSNAKEFVDNGFAPTYILGILNFTTNNGCPLLTYSRTIVNGIPAYKYCIKNLQPDAYITSTVNGKLKKTLTTLPTDWVLLQQGITQLVNIGQGILPDELVDVTTSIDCIKTNVSTLVSTKLTGIKTFDAVNGGIINIFLKLSTTDSQTLLVDIFIPSDATLKAERYVTGLSYFLDPATNIETIFVTTDSSVWKYFNSTWTLFISSLSDMSTSVTRALNTGLTSTMQLASSLAIVSTYLTGLRGFSIAMVPDITGEYLGFLGSAIGIIQYYFSVDKTGDLKIKDTMSSPGRMLKSNLYNSYTSWLTIPFGTGMIFSCSLKTTVPIRYDTIENSLYLSYIPIETESAIVEANSTTKEYFSRANYVVYNVNNTESVVDFLNSDTFYEFNYVPSDQLVDITSTSIKSVKLRPVLGIPVSSTYYEKKFLAFMDEPNFKKDENLYLYINKTFEKYVRLFVSHTKINTININDYVYSLSGTSFYYSPIKASSEALDSSITTYFLSDYVADGYVAVSVV